MTFSRYYPELDFVRAAAILMVLSLHLAENCFSILSGNGLLVRFISWGYSGVDLFFVLSGFLIGGRIIEESLNVSFSFRQFYIKRFFRIFPPYYAAMVVTVAVLSVVSHKLILLDTDVLKDFFFHLLYLQDYIHPPKGGFWFLTLHYWTLAVEEQFYLLIPVLLYLTIRFVRGYLLYTLLLLGVSGFFLRYWLSRHGVTGDWYYSYYMPFHTRFDSLIFGVLAAAVFIRFQEKLKSLFAWKALLFVFSVVSLGACIAFGNRGDGYFSTCWQFTLTGAGFASLILFLLSADTCRYLPFKKAAGVIAKYSYGMYLYHILTLVLINNLMARFFNISKVSFAAYLIILFLYILLTLFICMIIYWFIDKPCMNYRKKILDRNKKPGNTDAHCN